MAKGRKTKTPQKNKASKATARTLGELSDTELDGVAGGLGYGGKLAIPDGVRTIQSTPISAPKLSTKKLGYGG